MVTFSQVIEIDIAALESFAKHWNETIHRKIKEARAGFHDDVVRKLHDDHWRGEGGESAQKYCDRIELGIDSLDAQVRAVCRFIDEEADGARGTGGLKGLEALRRRAVDLNQEALDEGMRIGEDGGVSWSEFVDPNDPDTDAYVQGRQRLADSFEKRAEEILADARENDEWIADCLKVIFGTPHNFEVEDRRHGILEPTARDAAVHRKLNNVAAILATAKGWPTAAGLLKHYLDGSGRPVEVEPQQMMEDIPQFQEDVNKTLDEDVRKRPDGKFTTEWQSTHASNEDGERSMEWYYALHHFQYRIVGEKVDGEIHYQVEVQKRYDWGIPSEHRRDLDSGYPPPADFDFEQADIAHLNSVGMARDFDVKGRSDTMATCA
ncbi:hypothetical protein [Streptomyces sp. Da 82-17]|uniref:hypothetical protein n=1 Tax=Streptomyces sp. Da 82-17 TaxID=3377116 RepID=UPI0038D4D4F2